MRITKLDGLRGIFSMMVLIFHYPVDFLPDYVPSFFLVAKSYLFVDFFFVLSGFVISLNYAQKLDTNAELGSFVKKRFIRLYPLLLYTTLLMFTALASATIIAPHLVNHQESMSDYVINTIRTLLFLNATPVINDTVGMNYPSWSISAEMIAYLFFGLVMVWAAKQRRILVISSAVVIGISFLMIAEANHMVKNFAFVRGIVGFNIGYLVHHFSNRKSNFGRGAEAIILAVFLVLLYISHVYGGTTLKVLMEPCIIPLYFGSAIYVLIHSDGFISRAMDSRLCQFLGKVSYSIYLNHAIVLMILPKVIFAVLNIPREPVFEFTVLIIVMVAVAIYSHYTYTFIEVAGGRLLKRWMSKRQVTVGTMDSEKSAM